MHGYPKLVKKSRRRHLKMHPPGLLSLRVAQAVIKQVVADNSRT